jgi:hypothetical protein
MRIASDLERAIQDHETGNIAHVSARAGIDAAIESGLLAVRRLDAIVPNLIGHDRKATAAWHTARHIERLPRYAKNGAPAPAEPGAPHATV